MLPFSGRYLAAQSEVTGCHQRDADDDAELRAVAMPADASALPIEPRLRFQARAYVGTQSLSLRLSPAHYPRFQTIGTRAPEATRIVTHRD